MTPTFTVVQQTTSSTCMGIGEGASIHVLEKDAIVCKCGWLRLVAPRHDATPEKRQAGRKGKG